MKHWKFRFIISVMTGRPSKDNQLFINYEVEFMDKTGEIQNGCFRKIPFEYQPWMQKQLDPLKNKMPEIAGLGIVQLMLKDMMEMCCITIL